MDRVVVVGPPGSGKTTVGRALAEQLAVPYIEMDALWWEVNWTEAGSERLRKKLAPLVAGDRWVVDGNYFTQGARDVVWPRVDTVVWLDVPKWRTLARIMRRTVRRSVTRTELWSGNRERLRTVFARDELLRFAWREFPKYRARYSTIANDPTYSQVTVVHLTSPHTVRNWLASVERTMHDRQC